MNNRLSELESPDMPPFNGIDKEIRNKEIEIWTKATGIHFDIAFRDENPNTRDGLRKAIDELQEILDGVVVGEVFIDESQAAP